MTTTAQLTNDFDALFATDASAMTPSRAYLDLEGIWVCKVTECTYGKNKAGTGARAALRAEVLSSVGETPDRTGATTNLYINAGASPQLAQRNLSPYAQTLIALGVSKDKLLEDVTDYDDVIQNIVTHANKLLKRGIEIKVIVQTKEQPKLDTNGNKQFYKNVYLLKQEEVAPTA